MSEQTLDYQMKTPLTNQTAKPCHNPAKPFADSFAEYRAGFAAILNDAKSPIESGAFRLSLPGFVSFAARDAVAIH